jgi:thiol:disulfide interchange protein DsbD
MPQALVLQAATTFGAGILASLSPCVYPMIPITVGYIGSRSPGHVNRALGLFVLGQSITFTLLGVATVELGETLGFSSENRWINAGLGVFLVLMGLASLKGSLPGFLQRWSDRVQAFFTPAAPASAAEKKPPGFLRAALGPVALGAGAALVASPCTSPILGGVLALIASTGTVLQGSLLMFAYALGFSGILALASGGLLNLRKLPRSGPWLGYLHRVSVVLLLGSGLYYLYKGLATYA